MSNFCKKDNRENPCPPKLNEMSAAEACKQVQEKSINLSAAISKGFTTPGQGISDMFNGAANFIKAFGSNSNSVQETLVNVGLDIDTRKIAEQTSRCDSIIDNIQLNSIQGSKPECINAYAAAGFSPTELKEMMKLNITNFTQQNTADLKNKCVINQAINALSQMDASIDVSALMATLNSAKGMMSSSSSEQKSCVNINQKLSACQYLSQNQCCSNQISSKQTNLLDQGCSSATINNTTQINDNKAFNECLLDAGSSVSDVIKTAIKVKTESKAENKSEGLTMGFFIIIIIVLVLFFGGPMIFINKMGNMGRNVFFGLIGIIGLGFLVVYFFNGKSEMTVTNKPFVTCQGTNVKGPFQTTLGQLKTKFNEGSEFGYDFIQDDADKDIDDTRSGLGVFINSIQREGATCEPFEGKSYSYVKGYLDKKLLIIGIVLIVLSGLLLIVSISYSFINKNKDTQEENDDIQDQDLGQEAEELD
jgi:hypothetical protein